MTKTELCVRCDDEIPVGTENWTDYRTLTLDQETGALPMCMDCFDEVRDRDLW